MVQRRTNKGVVIDMEALLAQNSDEPAMGNMRVNAKGDVIGKNGEIIQTAEDRARAYYTENLSQVLLNLLLKAPSLTNRHKQNRKWNQK